ncbi:UNVERIFIED_CONTAM: hypothetical protein PYX00_010564 [Menopon gallinae]|uniref:Uncharacterized protein n=1 Tax=Menopon gallinae TaxID=328185 RepID=A0AAW2HG26_9NEOP
MASARALIDRLSLQPTDVFEWTFNGATIPRNGLSDRTEEETGAPVSSGTENARVGGAKSLSSARCEAPCKQNGMAEDQKRRRACPKPDLRNNAENATAERGHPGRRIPHGRKNLLQSSP